VAAKVAAEEVGLLLLLVDEVVVEEEEEEEEETFILCGILSLTITDKRLWDCTSGSHRVLTKEFN
jgi:hypothetical protein